MKSEIQDSSDRAGPCALWTAQSCKKKALELLVTFTVHLKRKKQGLLILNAWIDTAAVCKADRCQEARQVSKGAPEASGPGGPQTTLPPCVHICEQQLMVLREVGLSSQNGL